MGASRRIAGLVLAAGAARRFGAPKQLAEVDGRFLIEHAVRAVAAEPLLVADWADGQSASLRAGVAALAPHADAIVVTLGDQPWIAPATIARVVAAWDGSAPAVRATFDGRPGHPVLIARPLYAAVAELPGDVGARSLIEPAGAHEVACDAGAVLDVDTPEQLAEARRHRPGR